MTEIPNVQVTYDDCYDHAGFSSDLRSNILSDNGVFRCGDSWFYFIFTLPADYIVTHVKIESESSSYAPKDSYLQARDTSNAYLQKNVFSHSSATTQTFAGTIFTEETIKPYYIFCKLVVHPHRISSAFLSNPARIVTFLLLLSLISLLL